MISHGCGVSAAFVRINQLFEEAIVRLSIVARPNDFSEQHLELSSLVKRLDGFQQYHQFVSDLARTRRVGNQRAENFDSFLDDFQVDQQLLQSFLQILRLRYTATGAAS